MWGGEKHPISSVLIQCVGIKKKKKSKQDKFLNHVSSSDNINFADQLHTVLSSFNYADSSTCSIFHEPKHVAIFPLRVSTELDYGMCWGHKAPSCPWNLKDSLEIWILQSSTYPSFWLECISSD